MHRNRLRSGKIAEKDRRAGRRGNRKEERRRKPKRQTEENLPRYPACSCLQGDEWRSEKPDQGCLPLQQDDPACDTDSCSGKPIRIIHAHSHGSDGQLLWRLPPALSAGGICLLFRLDSARLRDPFPPCTGDAGRMHRWLSQRGLLPPLGRSRMIRSRSSCPMRPSIPPEKGSLPVSKFIPVRQMASQHPYPAKERRMFCCSRTSWLCKAQLPCPQESLSQCL